MRARAAVPACLMAAAVAAGCGSGATAKCKQPPDRALLQAVRAHAGRIVLRTDRERGNAAQLTITACQTSDSEATATLTVFGLRNESIQDMRHGVRLERRAGRWTVTADEHSRRCQPGHGSREFSTARCR